MERERPEPVLPTALPTGAPNERDEAGRPTGLWLVGDPADDAFLGEYIDGRLSGVLRRFRNGHLFAIVTMQPSPELLPDVNPLETASGVRIGAASVVGRGGSIPVGRERTLHPDGTVRSVTHYDAHGRRHGVHACWNEAGQLIEKAEYVDGLLHGPIRRLTAGRWKTRTYRHGAPALPPRTLGPLLRTLFLARDAEDVSRALRAHGDDVETAGRLLWGLAGYGLLTDTAPAVYERLADHRPRTEEVVGMLLRVPEGSSFAPGAERAFGAPFLALPAGVRVATLRRVAGSVRTRVAKVHATSSRSEREIEPTTDDHRFVDACLLETQPPEGIGPMLLEDELRAMAANMKLAFEEFVRRAPTFRRSG